eukprot:TRINITY_DN5912_c0_g1_i1.p1 TRINITY_DN5912_c0_g1~~TRINITY_DN5912_c0_g1_i1.p1  ORF type:complete len:1229 (-),score=455.15 TRINITY_DN5912_c0_g1_i1:71-3757(-)
MADAADTVPSEVAPAEAVAAAAPADGAPADGAPADGAPAEPEKKKRGKPKDPNAPVKPKNAFQQVTGEARGRLKEQRPELATDLKAMGMALKEEWEKFPQEEKDRMNAEYEKAMEIWRPQWEAYKKTDSFKEFFDLKQDWLDGREKKKLFKAHAKQAPKKPKSGYMIFGGEVREACAKEVADEGGTMADIGRKISERWTALSEAQKAEYAETSARQKEEFDKLYAEHKKTDIYKQFCKDRFKMEGRHALKKLERTSYKEAPARPQSSFGLFKKSVLKQVMEENKGASAGELSKKVGEKWKGTSAEERAPFEKEAADLKETYLKQVKEFKKKKAYSNFLTKRAQVKFRENRLVNLSEMPKKPKTVFALFREEVKDEVPAGKGEGKGMSWVKTKFQTIEESKKQEYLAKEAELKQKFQEDVKTFKAGDMYKEYEKTEGKIKKELMTDGMKLMTLKFLDDAPPQPPKTPFSVFVGEKRQAASEAGGEPPAKKSKQELKAEVAQFQEEWKKFDKDTKLEYETKRKDKTKAWKEEIKAYMAQDIWKEYIAEAKTLKVPVRNLLMDKKQAIRKLKNGMTLLPLPDKPEDMPSKPAQARRLFIRAKKAEGADVTTLPSLWENMPKEEKAKYEEEAAELEKKYNEEMKAFMESEDGKEYFKKMRQVTKSRKVAIAKDKYLTGMPKKPLSALALYMKQELKSVKKEKPDLKGFELKKELTERWKAMEEDKRNPLEEAAAKTMAEYEETVKLFKSSENYIAFQKTMKVINKSAKPKAKGKAKAAPSLPPPKKPESMPTPPLNAFKAYCKEQTGKGKGLGDLAKDFQTLDDEEKKRLNEEAGERKKKYDAEMKDWQKGEEGKKYLTALKTFGKRKRIAVAKAKFLKDPMPKKPPHAMMLFAMDKRPQLAKEFPELKGLAETQKKISELWQALSEEDKKVYTEKASEKMAAFKEELEAYKSSDNFKKFQDIMKKSGAPKAKAKAKGKAGKAPSGPAPPANMPVKPKQAMALYMAENKGGGGLADQAKAWRELGAEGQKKYVDQAKELASKYEEEMKEFQNSAEGKKYIRLKAAADKKNKMDAAKEKFLGDAPKQPKSPPGAYQLFVAEKRPSMSGKIGEVAKELSNMWKDLSDEDKKPFEEKAAELKAEYDKEMAEYKSSEGYKKWEKFNKGQKSSKPKAKAKKAAKTKKAAPKKKAAGRGGGGGRGRGAKKAKAASDVGSDSDVMGSDTSSSSSDSDSD